MQPLKPFYLGPLLCIIIIHTCFSRCVRQSIICVTVFPQPVMCGTWALWRWSRWQAAKQCRKPPQWPWTSTRCLPPPWSTSKSLPRASPSLTTRGSEFCICSVFPPGMRPCSHHNCLPSSFRLFFRRHYNVNTVIYCALDPHDRKWVLLIWYIFLVISSRCGMKKHLLDNYNLSWILPKTIYQFNMYSEELYITNNLCSLYIGGKKMAALQQSE